MMAISYFAALVLASAPFANCQECVQPYVFYGIANTIRGQVPNATRWEDCQELCTETPDCNTWVWRNGSHNSLPETCAIGTGVTSTEPTINHVHIACRDGDCRGCEFGPVIGCDTTGKCQDQTLYCDPFNDCEINCGAENTCAGSTIVGPVDGRGDLTVICSATNGCSDIAGITGLTTLQCNAANACTNIQNIECNAGLEEFEDACRLECLAEGSCNELEFECPSHSACDVQCDGETACSNLVITPDHEQPFRATCSSDCPDEVVCASGVWECEENVCVDGDLASCDNDFPVGTSFPTLSPTPSPTNVPTTVPTNAPTPMQTDTPTVVATGDMTMVPTTVPPPAPVRGQSPSPTSAATVLPTDDRSDASTQGASGDSPGGNNTMMFIIIGVIVVIVLSICIGCCLRRKYKKKENTTTGGSGYVDDQSTSTFQAVPTRTSSFRRSRIPSQPGTPSARPKATSTPAPHPAHVARYRTRTRAPSEATDSGSEGEDSMLRNANPETVDEVSHSAPAILELGGIKTIDRVRTYDSSRFSDMELSSTIDTYALNQPVKHHKSHDSMSEFQRV